MINARCNGLHHLLVVNSVSKFKFLKNFISFFVLEKETKATRKS